ncbi:hypothetical protein BJY01DRAFT_251551 [Aspergillus pseudoustus]|uniref:AA1-like domain-containing protein n=1 Tax=Aspergillus pseudoustus TaxID=1810923 RepID=A0ABR4JB95_9EURO
MKFPFAILVISLVAWSAVAVKLEYRNEQMTDWTSITFDADKCTRFSHAATEVRLDPSSEHGLEFVCFFFVDPNCHGPIAARVTTSKPNRRVKETFAVQCRVAGSRLQPSWVLGDGEDGEDSQGQGAGVMQDDWGYL